MQRNLTQITDAIPEEQEFVQHINRVLQQNMGVDHDLSRLIQPKLHQFMMQRAIDAMDWVLRCMMGDMEFDQSTDDEIPILCKYYTSFVREENWTDDDHTIMMVLGKYNQIKLKGRGNFAHTLLASGDLESAHSGPTLNDLADTRSSGDASYGERRARMLAAAETRRQGNV